ncbi:MAG: type IV toxin-antitoxin system AbiEi family antitoxin domain-containing protein [Limisphaerales bacterium]
MSNRTDQLLALARELGVLRPRDLEAHKIPRAYLGLAVQRKLLERAGRGLYRLPDAEVTEHQALIESAKRVPHSVVCLLSALQFHGLTTQLPADLWLAIGEKAWRPKQEYPPLRVVYFSGKALTEGIETHIIQNVPVRVYSAAKTIADCFKYRNKVGLDVAMEALRDGWRQRKATADALWHFAKVCRVANVMRPYLESLA